MAIKIDRVSALSQELGREATDAMFDRYNKTINVSEELLWHGNLHTFNLLVGTKPRAPKASRISMCQEIDVVLCDFEMSCQALPATTLVLSEPFSSPASWNIPSMVIITLLSILSIG